MRYCLKSHTINGKAKYGYIYAKNYKQVKEKLKSITQTVCVQDKNIERGTYSELLSKWLQSKLIAVKESTFSRYSRIVDVYIIPYLGDLYVSEFSTAIIEQFTHNLLTSGKKDGSGGLSSKTVSDILVVIKSSLEYGHENGYSVNCNAKRILIKKHDKEMRVLTPAEQIKFVSYLREDMDLYKFGTLLSLYTGIRIGELCALRWENIQSDINAIIIRETLQRIPSVEEKSKTKIIITEPKSECSVREIPCLIAYTLLLLNSVLHPNHICLQAIRKDMPSQEQCNIISNNISRKVVFHLPTIIPSAILLPQDVLRQDLMSKA